MQDLIKKIDNLAAEIPNANRLHIEISAANVAWHIEHSCLVIIKISETILKSNPSNYKPSFSFKKQLVFFTGKFPRGRANAPEVVMPQDNLSLEHLQQSILNAKTAIQKLSSCDKNNYFTHPIFGQLNIQKTIKFFGIHTSHHIHIIKDILAFQAS
jgi:hypothetical protein